MARILLYAWRHECGGQFVVNARPGFLLAIARRVADEPTSTPRSSHGERPSAPHRNLFPDVVCQTRPPPRARAFLTHSPPIRKYRARTRTTLLSYNRTMAGPEVSDSALVWSLLPRNRHPAGWSTMLSSAVYHDFSSQRLGKLEGVHVLSRLS